MATQAVTEGEALILSGEFISLSTSTSSQPSTPLYRISKSIDSLTFKDSSVQFSRVEEEEEGGGGPRATDERTNPASSSGSSRRLFTLVHPLNADYRTDIPAQYYLTSSSSSTSISTETATGNVKFQITKSFFGKVVEIKALQSKGRTETSSPLFDDDDDDDKSAKVILVGKRKFGGGGCFVWMDGEGNEVAREENSSSSNNSSSTGAKTNEKKESGANTKKLVILRKIVDEEERDVLTAVWVLRLWWGVAEEGKFKREAEMALLSGTGEQTLLNMRWAKKAGIAGLSGAGGAR